MQHPHPLQCIVGMYSLAGMEADIKEMQLRQQTRYCKRDWPDKSHFKADSTSNTQHLLGKI